jgi:large subunit ribosomal protein L29
MKAADELNELRGLDADELGDRLKQARRELYELRFKLAVGQLENNREIRKARKSIARILTVVHQHRLEGAEGEGAIAVAEAPEQPELAGAEASVETENDTDDETEEDEKE